MHGIARDVIVGVIASATFLILYLAALPWLRAFFGDWKEAWDDYAEKRIKRLQIFVALYRIKRRTRRARLLTRLHTDTKALIRYIAVPVCLTSVAVLNSFHSSTNANPAAGNISLSIAIFFSEFVRLVVMVVWLFFIDTILDSGSKKHIDNHLSKTEEMMQRLASLVDELSKSDEQRDHNQGIAARGV